jgi:hypothetical protein
MECRSTIVMVRLSELAFASASPGVTYPKRRKLPALDMEKSQAHLAFSAQQ